MAETALRFGVISEFETHHRAADGPMVGCGWKSLWDLWKSAFADPLKAARNLFNGSFLFRWASWSVRHSSRVQPLKTIVVRWLRSKTRSPPATLFGALRAGLSGDYMLNYLFRAISNWVVSMNMPANRNYEQC
jgi:hypothetical protein